MPAPNRGFVVGTWNLEYLHNDRSRGFPEYLAGGPLYAPRTDADYAAIADVLRDKLRVDLVSLQEINAETESDAEPRSGELERLLTYLGPPYQGVVSRSGGNQHLAVCWNSRRVRVDTTFELSYPPLDVSGDLFARDPLVVGVTLIHEGVEQSDLLFVALHLASGRSRTRNHDSALALLADTLSILIQSPASPLVSERDILLAGDFNFDPYDAYRERVLEEMHLGSWQILSDPNGPLTRLGGVPLLPASRLDFMICSDAMTGPRRIIDVGSVQAHIQLATGGYDAFRGTFSDHVPVTVRLRPAPDDD